MTQILLSEREFFESHSRRVNRIIDLILFVAVLVPVSFIVLTLAGIWAVPHTYSFALLLITLASAFILLLMNKFISNYKIPMFFGLLACSIFIFTIGYKPFIAISLSFAFVPFISCLYLDRKLTNIISVLNLLLTMVCFIFRAKTFNIFFEYKFLEQTAFDWFKSNFFGVAIEYIFVFLLTNALSSSYTLIIQKLIEKQENSEVNNKKQKDIQFEIIEFISKCFNSYNSTNAHHEIHTQLYVELIAKKLKENKLFSEILTDETIELYRQAAFLHDVGAFHVPENILNSSKIYTEEERKIMETHTTEGAKLLEFLPTIGNGNFNKIAAEMALNHHERWDGKGYPNQCKGSEIPLCARIMAAADSLDAMISQRLYKEPVTIEEALNIFQEEKEKQFDPAIVETILGLKKEIEQIDKTFKQEEKISISN